MIGVATDRTGAMSLDARRGQRRPARDRGRRHRRDDGPGRDRPARRARRPPRRSGAWFHVDAAVGSGLVLSRAPAAAPGGHRARRFRHRRPAQAVVAAVRRQRPARRPTCACCSAVHHASVYLNRPEDEAEGQLNLVGRSLDTSRRFDALKVLVGLRATGRRGSAEMVDDVLALTQHAGRAVDGPPRARAAHAALDGDGRVPPCAGATGTTCACIASCSRPGRRSSAAPASTAPVALKLTLLNPRTTPEDVDALLDPWSARQRNRELHRTRSPGGVAHASR